MDLSQYVGLPFADGGRGPDGYDCWGLLRLVYAERFGISLPSFCGQYVSTVDRAAVERLIAGGMSDWRAVPEQGAEIGDAVLMLEGGASTHCGVVAGAGLVLHVMRGGSSVIESVRCYRLRSSIVGYYRHVTRTP